jgi:hypothetical protein
MDTYIKVAVAALLIGCGVVLAVKWRSDDGSINPLSVAGGLLLIALGLLGMYATFALGVGGGCVNCVTM